MSKRIFKSHQVNLDPKPYIDKNGNRARWLAAVMFSLEYSPRPEFESTRDPEPWVSKNHGGRGATHLTYDDMAWAPRREQFDTPVNRMLVFFRENYGDEDKSVSVEYWVEQLDDPTLKEDYTPDEIEHAQNVLARLARWNTHKEV